MHSLVYAGKDVEELLKKEYPECKITDASDYIHTERFEFEEDNIEEDDFYIFAIRNGFALNCLGFNLKLHSQKGTWDLIAEANALEESEKET